MDDPDYLTRLRDTYAGDAMRMLMATQSQRHPLNAELSALLRLLASQIPETDRTHELRYQALQMVDRLAIGATNGDIAKWAFWMADVMVEQRDAPSVTAAPSCALVVDDGEEHER